MPRSPSSTAMPLPALVAGVALPLLLAWPAGAQTASRELAHDSAGQIAKDSAAHVAATNHSRLGRFGGMLRKAATTAEAKTGISKETTARIAIAAATGGAGEALLSARSTTALGASNGLASLARKAALRSTTTGAAGSVAAGQAAQLAQMAAMQSAVASAKGAAPGQSPAAVTALQQLGQISLRATQGDPAARRAMDALNAAVSSPTSDLSAMERRAQAGDPSAAQEIIIREAQIANAALAGKKP